MCVTECTICSVFMWICLEYNRPTETQTMWFLFLLVHCIHIRHESERKKEKLDQKERKTEFFLFQISIVGSLFSDLKYNIYFLFEKQAFNVLLKVIMVYKQNYNLFITD